MRALVTLSVVLVSGHLAFSSAQTSKTPATAPGWPGWGGPRHDFTADAKGLADTWPAEGPRRLWSRPLGEGHSSIVVDAGQVFTMYRQPTGEPNRWNAEEVVVALDAASGRTIWEYRFPLSMETLNFRSGAGPHATPLVVEDRVFAAATDKQFLALDKATGQLLWSHDFVKEFKAPPNQMRFPVRPGYAPSPVAYKDLVIAQVGGPGQGVMAFRQDDGRVVWKGGEFLDISPATPIVITLGGQDQLVVASAAAIHGFDPTTGKQLWSHEVPDPIGGTMSTPVWSAADRLLFTSQAYGNGSRLFQLTRTGASTEAKLLWYSKKTFVHFATVLRLGDYYYTSSGDYGPFFLMCVDVHTGDVAWRDRTFARASLLAADGKVIVLDEDGTLALITVSPDGVKVLAKAQVASTISWTVPALVGTTLYLRDRVNIMALDLGKR